MRDKSISSYVDGRPVGGILIWDGTIGEIQNLGRQNCSFLVNCGSMFIIFARFFQKFGCNVLMFKVLQTFKITAHKL